MKCRTLMALLVLTLLPTASASWGIDSSDTGPGNLVIYNDYWNDGRLTFSGNTLSFQLVLRAGQEGEYFFEVPDKVSDQTNPLFALYDDIQIQTGRGPTIKLSESSRQSTQTIHLEQNEYLNATITMNVRDLDVQARNDVEAGMTGRAGARADELSGWLSVTATEQEAPGQPGYYVLVQERLNLGLVHHLAEGSLSETVSPPQERDVTKDGRSDLIQGPTIVASEDTRYRIQLNGSLAQEVVEFLYEDGTPVQMIPVDSQDGLQNAIWLPGDESITLLIPKGSHTIYYRITGEGELKGRVLFTNFHTGAETSDVLDLTKTSKGGTMLWLVLGVAAFLLLAAVLVALLRRQGNAGAVDDAEEPEEEEEAEEQEDDDER